MEFKVSTLFIEQSLKKHFHKHSLLGDKKYFDPYLIPVAKELEDSFPAIQAELKAILKRYDEFANFQDISPDQTYISNDDRWRMFFFKAANVNFGRNQEFAPELFKILNRHREVISAYISVLGPRKMLMPHQGPWSGVLRMHLGVVIPGHKECVLINGGEEYHWEEGKVVLFDDTYETRCHQYNGSNTGGIVPRYNETFEATVGLYQLVHPSGFNSLPLRLGSVLSAQAVGEEVLQDV
jgi:aspartyl/asparaginyl beta-hydroxylase (cupin superfamily)